MSKTFHYDDTLGFVRRTLRYGNAPTIIESTIGQLNSDPAVNEANANTSNALNALDCIGESEEENCDLPYMLQLRSRSRIFIKDG